MSLRPVFLPRAIQKCCGSDGKIGVRKPRGEGSAAKVLGRDVTVGHSALLHACTVEDRGFVGMQACVMDGAVVESDAMVAAGALVPPQKVPRGAPRGRSVSRY